MNERDTSYGFLMAFDAKAHHWVIGCARMPARDKPELARLPIQTIILCVI